MKSKDIQKVVKTKYELWVKMINNTGFIDLQSPPGRPHTARTKANISKAKRRLDQKKRVST